MDSERRINIRRVSLLYETNSSMFAGGVASVLAYAYLTRTAHSETEGRLWLALMLAAFGFRFATQKLFAKRAASRESYDAVFFERLYATGLFLTASGWGIAGSVLLPEKPELVLVLGLVNVGLIAGGATAYAVSRASTLAVMLPMSLPLAVTATLRGGETLMAMGWLIVFFAFTMLRHSRLRRDFVLQAWKVAEEKDQLSRELIEAQAQAAQASKMAALGEMAAVFAHEVNTPLAIIGVCAQTIQEEAVEAEPSLSKISEYAAQAESTVTRIAKVVAELKAATKKDQKAS